MASFSNVWPLAGLPSAYVGGVAVPGLAGSPTDVAALRQAAASTVLALSELATPRGVHTVRTTPMTNPTRRQQASLPAALLVGSSVLTERVAA
jgi:MFS superfamily sulfate permease-like transporter